jgi:hypothetical protein
MTKKQLVTPTVNELPIVRKYLKQAIEFIEDIKLVKYPNDKGEAMKENEWESMAIKFKPLKKHDLISIIVLLKADEYLGSREGYHVFWWD